MAKTGRYYWVVTDFKIIADTSFADAEKGIRHYLEKLIFQGSIQQRNFLPGAGQVIRRSRPRWATADHDTDLRHGCTGLDGFEIGHLDSDVIEHESAPG